MAGRWNHFVAYMHSSLAKLLLFFFSVVKVVNDISCSVRLALFIIMTSLCFLIPCLFPFFLSFCISGRYETGHFNISYQISEGD